jgi:hypothetical protein
MPRAETAPDVKHTTSTSLLLQDTALPHKGSNSSALERWLHESPKEGPWVSGTASYALPLRGVSTKTQRVDGLSISNSRDKETIKPGELRALAQKVYTTLGAVQERTKRC